ncbi:YkvA family protein [Peribacillus deserti]|uniref:Methyltransferase type 11 n=1 Tax=Peribacillus deserti TaxID=673318 RepID=A0A2N5M8T7_9BACI|nr:YkvA family protein [Peribacillus deserti]PLT30755.1 methyltransferase type 11 [Peribacillus deserti]
MKDSRKFAGGYKVFLSKAQEYMDSKDRVKGLLKEAAVKAADKKGSLNEAWDNLQLLFQMVQAWVKGDYKEIPKKSILTILAVLLYFVVPTDAIPDFVFALGFIDDAAVIGFAVKQLVSDLDDFKAWKNSQAPIELD